jgi:hypothetical protein
MSTAVIERLDRAEYALEDALAGLPAASNGAGGMREKALETLEKVRTVKRQLLAREPDVLRKSSAAVCKIEPRWRGLLPVDTIAADTVAKEARSRAAEEQRLAKRTGGDASREIARALPMLKTALRRPAAAGNRQLIDFLTGRAGR